MRIFNLKQSKYLSGLSLFLISGFLYPAPAIAHKLGAADFNIRAGVNGTYDDNITYASQSPLSDFITSLNIGSDLTWERPTQLLRLSGDIRENIFASHNRFTNTAEELGLSFSHEFNRSTRMRITDNYSHTYEPQTFADAFGRVQGRYGYHRNNFRISFEKDVLKQLTLSTYYSNQANLISNSTLNDSYLNLVGVDAMYQFNSKTQAGIGYEYSERSFDKNGGDSHTHSLSVNVRQYLTEKLYFDGKLGVDFITAFTGRELTRPRIEASITEEFDRVTTGKLSFERRYTTSSFVSDLFNEWRLSAFLTRYFTERLKVTAHAFYGEGEYSGIAREDELSGVNLGLYYDLTKNLTGNITYSYSETSSSLADQGYTKNSISMGLASEF